MIFLKKSSLIFFRGCRCVCKSWFNNLSFSSNNLDFVKMQLDHALENQCSLMIEDSGVLFCYIDSVSSEELCYEPVKVDTPFNVGNISGSCNGLLCIRNGPWGIYIIWNPSTKEYKQLPLSPKPVSFHYVSYGFSLDCNKYDYKLVEMLTRYPPDILDVNVYTLRSNSWRKVVQSNPRNHFVAKETIGLLLNGALHWITEVPEVIVSFHIGDERFQEIEVPNCLVAKETSNLSVLRGDLCIIDHVGESLDVWVMKDYGVTESWTKLFSIARENSISYYKPLYSFKNGEILFWVRLNLENDRRYVLVSYDPKHERARMLKIRGFPRLCKDIQTYVGSLISPN